MFSVVSGDSIKILFTIWLLEPLKGIIIEDLGTSLKHVYIIANKKHKSD